MKRTPCEYIFWNLLPTLRNEIAKSMVYDFGLNQKEASVKLGITPAAVCMYFSDKRGNIKIRDKRIINEIQISASNIIKEESIDLTEETCRLCKFISSKGLLPFSNSKSIDRKGDLILCKF